MIIFDVPDPNVAAAISGIGVASGAVQDVKLTRLLTQDEVTTRQPQPSFVADTSRPVNDVVGGRPTGCLHLEATCWQRAKFAVVLFKKRPRRGARIGKNR